jgi:hypothetical protein
MVRYNVMVMWCLPPAVHHAPGSPVRHPELEPCATVQRLPRHTAILAQFKEANKLIRTDAQKSKETLK